MDYLSPLPLDPGCNIIDRLDFSSQMELLSMNKPLSELATNCITRLESKYWVTLHLTGLSRLRRLRKLDQVLIGVNYVKELPLLNMLPNLETYDLLVQIRSLTDLTALSPVLSDLRLKELILQTQLSPIELIKRYKELTQRPVKVYMYMPHYSWVTPIYKVPGLLYVYYPVGDEIYYWTLDQTTETFIHNNVDFDELKVRKLHWILNPTFRDQIFKNLKMGLKKPTQPPSDRNPDLKSLPGIRDANWSFDYLDTYEIPIILNNWKVNIDEDDVGTPLLTTINSVERQTLDNFRFPDSYDYEHEQDGETEDEDKLKVSFDLRGERKNRMVNFLNRNHHWTVFDLLLLKDPRIKLNAPELRQIGGQYEDLARNGGVWYDVEGTIHRLE